MNDDYDTPWKDALTRYFPEFVAFYFPAAHRQIDWTAPCVFLEQELAQVTRDAHIGCRRVDKLVRVTRVMARTSACLCTWTCKDTTTGIFPNACSSTTTGSSIAAGGP